MHIDGGDVARLNNHQFRKIINALLTVEANENRVPLDDLELNTRETDPDAGLDARARWPASAPHDPLPAGEIGFQYKSGKLSPDDLEAELSKKGVRDTLRRGGHYLLLVGHDYPPPTRDNRQKDLARICRSKRLPLSRCKILYGDQIARWVSRYTAVANLPELGKPFPGFATVDQWRHEGVFQNQFRADPKREAVIEAIRVFVSTPGSGNVVRIEGPAGVGKSRLALEALSKRGVAESTLYAPDAEAQQVQGLLAFIQSSVDEQAIVVVDECTFDRQEVLARYARLAGPRLRLICVGPAESIVQSPVGLTPVYQLLPLPDVDIEQILLAAETGIPPEVVATTVRVSGGYVKLALFVARILGKNNVPLFELRQIHDIRQILKKFVPKETAQSLEALSLLGRVGWEDELRGEAEALAGVVGLQFVQLQRSVKELKDQGVVLPRGRYLYVSPDLLAINAAADLWEERGAGLIHIVADLPGAGPRRQLLIRLAMMSEHKDVRKAVEQLLGSDGLFKTIEDLDEPFLSEVFRILCAALPQAALAALSRILIGTPRSRLLSFEAGRRNVIWALESLLRWPETSLEAARCLRELALAETEDIANNATGLFEQYFQMFLSASPIPLTDRLRLLDDLIDSLDPASHKLALRAAAGALKRYEGRSGIDIDTISLRTYPPEWRPRTSGDLRNARLSAIQCIRALEAKSAEISKAARSALIDSTHTLARDGMIDEAVGILESIEPRSEEERRVKAEAATWILTHRGTNLSEPHRSALQGLIKSTYGEDFESQLKRWVGRRMHADYDLEGGTGFTKADENVTTLAEQAYSRGLGESELTWLCSPEAENVWPFGKRLGEIDRDECYLDRIIEMSSDDTNCMLLASYLSGLSSTRGENLWDEVSDSLIERRPMLAFGITWRGPATAMAGKRVAQLIDSGSIANYMLQVLMYGGWAASLPSSEKYEILRRLLYKQDETLTVVALSILTHSIEKEPDVADRFRDLIWEALARPLANSRFAGDWEWGVLAKSLAAKDPKRVTRLIIDKMTDDSSWLRYEEIGQDILRAVTLVDYEAAWSVVSAALLDQQGSSYRLLFGLEHWYGDLIPPEELVQWARSHSSRARSIAVRLISVEGAPMPERLRALLKAFPEDEELIRSVLASLGSGSWMGPYSGRLQRECEVLRSWEEGADPWVRKWVTTAVQRLQRGIEKQLKIEQEEGIFSS